MTAAVELVDVSRRFHGTAALRKITVSTGPGGTGLLGANGSGKTTLLRVVATVLRPTGGSVRVLGEDPATAAGRLAIRRRLGYVPQRTDPYGGFTAYDFVDYVALVKEMSDARARGAEVARVLDAVGMTEDMHRTIRTLSGGMRRRVVLAQALLGRPHLLVLDEPTAGLDAMERLRFRERVAAVARDGAVLISSHAADDILALCDRVIVLSCGAVRFAGTCADLAAVADGRVWSSEEPHPASALRCSRLTADGLHRHLGDPPPGAALLRPSLEDGYLALVDPTAKRTSDR